MFVHIQYRSVSRAVAVLNVDYLLHQHSRGPCLDIVNVSSREGIRMLVRDGGDHPVERLDA